MQNVHREDQSKKKQWHEMTGWWWCFGPGEEIHRIFRCFLGLRGNRVISLTWGDIFLFDWFWLPTWIREWSYELLSIFVRFINLGFINHAQEPVDDFWVKDSCSVQRGGDFAGFQQCPRRPRAMIWPSMQKSFHYVRTPMKIRISGCWSWGMGLFLGPKERPCFLRKDLEPATVGNGDSCWSTCHGQCPNDVLKPGLMPQVLGAVALIKI